MTIHHAESIEEAIDDLQTFFESDIWYSKENEWKTEEDMIKYLRSHFEILRKEIERLEPSNTLSGKDADEFVKKMLDTEKRSMTEKESELSKKVDETMEKLDIVSDNSSGENK